MKIKKLLSIAIIIAVLLTSFGCAPSEDENLPKDDPQPENELITDVLYESAVLVPKPLAPNAVEQNPFMAPGDSAVHNDSYSSDVTNAVLPLGIDEIITSSLETENPQAPSAAFYDEEGNAITPFNGGVAIVDMDGEVIARKGVFVPAMHDEVKYSVQISYSFVDNLGNVVLPTSHGHVIILKTRDGNGEILPVFEKIADFNVADSIKTTLGEEYDTRLLSIVYDYEGNLWFVTGGFMIIPENSPAGVFGYISREAIDAALSGEAHGGEGFFLYALEKGESAENGISSNGDGAVILTNKACYMLNAENGVAVKWRTEYGSNGVNAAQPESGYTGGGLAYGSGTTPTLTKDLVLFTDNLDPVNVIALSSKTGELVASIPVLDGLPEGTPVSVENSILVYSGDESRVSVLVCNWFGAGNAALTDPDADSSVQTYANIYDQNWTNEGNKYIAPGVERVDIVKENGGYKAEKVWFREDICDTSMIKLSTATGYFYGYWQNLETGMWCYEVLDFETGETVWELPVSDIPEYNNMAVGMISDVKGNSLYCPTNKMEMLALRDIFVTLPENSEAEISPVDMERYYVSELENFTPASYLMKATAKAEGETVFAFRVNGLDKPVKEYKLMFGEDAASFGEFTGEWSICTADGVPVEDNIILIPENIYEIRIAAGSESDLDESEEKIKVSVLLVY